tara:strand:+ start:45 stop:491 length:447 start_codon:yes stop_codon:yes gene_type:complete
MKFNGINNQCVEFKITNYEFPKITDCEYDSNWLLIYLDVKSDCGNWKTSHPSLLTRDVKRIIEWFKELSENIRTENSLDFLEPNIAFELLEFRTDKKLIRILFDLESRPQNANDEKEYFVDCEMDNNTLKKVATELKKEAEPFPERAL